MSDTTATGRARLTALWTQAFDRLTATLPTQALYCCDHEGPRLICAEHPASGALCRTCNADHMRRLFAIAAGLSAVKSVLASRVGDRDSAALLSPVEAR